MEEKEIEGLRRKIEDLERNLEAVAAFILEHAHRSPVSAYCESILTMGPVCEDGYATFTGQRSYVMCRAFKALEERKVESLGEGIRLGWKEVHEKCGR